MSFSKRSEQTTTVLPDGQMQIKTTTIIEENGVEISRANHRHVLDVDESANNEHELTKTIAAAVRTQARIDARVEARQAARDAA